jgi:hypothetical protein
MMVPPRVPDTLPQPDGRKAPLPTPRQVEQPGQPLELPPSGLHPAGAYDPTQSGSFGSLPIRLTRDFPSIHDFLQQGRAHDDKPAPPDDSGNIGLQRFFVSGEYLLWWLPGFPTPVLATTNPNTALNGFLGEPGTTAILGPGPLLNSTRSGVRVRAGMWFDECGTCGIDASFFILPAISASTVVNSNQFPLITRPVFVPNPIPGTNTPIGENGESVAIPGILSGSVTAHASSQLWGLDVNLRKCLCNNCDLRAEVFAGYRYLNLMENLTITENISVIGPGGNRINLPDPIGTQVVVQDRFGTLNEFNGGQFGALYDRHWGRWDVDIRGSVALGDTHQILNISGFQVRQRPGMAPMTFSGGLLAAGPNLGRFTSDRFSVVPELTLSAGYHITNNIRVFAGYNFLVWTNVIRPGDQIDHTVDLTVVPNAPAVNFSGQNRPHPLFTQRDLVVNGVQFGLELRW